MAAIDKLFKRTRNNGTNQKVSKSVTEHPALWRAIEEVAEADGLSTSEWMGRQVAREKRVESLALKYAEEAKQ